MNFKKRDGLMAAFLSVITCGIYRLYFWYCIGEDVNIIALAKVIKEDELDAETKKDVDDDNQQSDDGQEQMKL